MASSLVNVSVERTIALLTVVCVCVYIYMYVYILRLVRSQLPLKYCK
jgi:hypothetical protein